MPTKEQNNRLSEQIKERVTIPMVWEWLYGSAPKRFPASCPWRKDENPSLGVSPDRRVWYDHGTKDSGDIFNFARMARGWDARVAWLKVLERFGSEAGPAPLPKAEPVTVESKRRRQFHPPLKKPTTDELTAISVLRSISVEGLKIAVDRGFLWMTEWHEAQAFAVTDKSRRCYTVRKISGELWEGGAKAVFLPGSNSHWPIGIREAEKYPAIALCEGAPDFLACFGHAWASGLEDRIAPVCMSTAQASIPDDTLSYFKEKKVRIFSHNDPAGREALKRWAGQLYGIASIVDNFDFAGLIQADGQPVNDLNDLSKIEYDNWEANRQRVEAVMGLLKLVEGYSQ
jgi:hypothetical protein